MKIKILLLTLGLFVISVVGTILAPDPGYHTEFHPKLASLGISQAEAYPPGVGILTKSRNCVSCHQNNGPWKDDDNTIIDIIDKDTRQSLKQPDGSFLIVTERYKAKTVYTILGSKNQQGIPRPEKNGWIYIDTTTINKNTLSKFAPGWEVDLPLSCRIAGDKVDGFEDATLTSLPMTIRPLTDARDSRLMLQGMLSRGKAEKQNTGQMLASYFERTVYLKIKE